MLQGMLEAEKKSQTQLEALRAEKQSTAERLQAVQSESQTVAAQVQTLQADKQAAAQQVKTMREEVRTVQQQLQAIDADKAAAAEQLRSSRLALQKERAEWEQQRREWEAERSAKAEREKQLQHDMAAMQAMLEEYKAVLQSGKRGEQDRAEAGKASKSKGQASEQLREKLERPSTAIPLTPGAAHDGSSSDDTAQPRMSEQQTPAAAALGGETAKRAFAKKGQSPSVEASTPARTVLEFGSVSGTTTAKYRAACADLAHCALQKLLKVPRLHSTQSCMVVAFNLPALLPRCVWARACVCVCVCVCVCMCVCVRTRKHNESLITCFSRQQG